MPAMAFSRVGARVVESGPGGQELAAFAWQQLEALPDPRSPQGRIYPLACLIAIALCAFTAAGETGSPRSGSGSASQPGRTWPGSGPRGTRWQAGTGHRREDDPGRAGPPGPAGPGPGPARAAPARAPARWAPLGQRAQLPCPAGRPARESAGSWTG